MKNFKYLLGVFPIYLILSCKPAKTITIYRDVIKTDTLSKVVKITSFATIHDTLTIENPCDSLRLKDFYYKSNLPQGKVIIRSVQGKIQATIDIDSIKQIYSEIYKSNQRVNIQYTNRDVVRNVVPSWAIITILIETLIIALYLYIRLIWK